MTENLNEYADLFSQNIYEKLEKAEKYHRNYSLMNLLTTIKKLSKEERYKVFEILFTRFIELLKPHYKEEEIFVSGNRTEKEIAIDDLLEYFIKIGDDDACEADFMVCDLLNKATGKNNRTLDLPINIEYMMEYQVGNFIEQENVIKVILYAILKLHIMYYLFVMKEN